MAEVTFRDFAGAVMAQDSARAAEVLAQLLGVSADLALAAATHFERGMKSDPQFMMKAMGLRGAVTGGSDAEIGALLEDCFGLQGDAVAGAVATLRKQYPAPP